MAVPSLTPLDRTTQLTTVLHTLLEQATARLTHPVGLATLTPGATVPWDDCCSGQLWVRVASITPWISGPAQPSPVSQCRINGWNVTAGIGVLRCAYTITEDGTFPTAAEMLHDFNMLAIDSDELSQALVCDFPSTPRVQRFQMGNWTPIGVDSGCAGGEWNFTFSLPYCGC